MGLIIQLSVLLCEYKSLIIIENALLPLKKHVCFYFQTVLYSGVVLYAPTIAFTTVTALPWWGSILLLGSCSTIYTTLGGILAIVWAVSID